MSIHISLEEKLNVSAGLVAHNWGASVERESNLSDGHWQYRVALVINVLANQIDAP